MPEDAHTVFWRAFLSMARVALVHRLHRVGQNASAVAVNVAVRHAGGGVCLGNGRTRSKHDDHIAQARCAMMTAPGMAGQLERRPEDF